MPETDEQPEDEELEGFSETKRVNFRDYPSSGLVVLAALSSGLGWMLFKWLDKKRKARNGAAAEATSGQPSPPQPTPPDDNP